MSPQPTAVAVFCGSSRGADPAFGEAAAAFGRLLAQRRVRLVYGGGEVGLMGVVANAVLDAGGEVHGVITRALDEKEIAHKGLTSLTIVETMHERKAAMADAADAFVMLPGGYGTLDEFFEAATWTQLGIHEKPCGVLDVGGYFDAMRAFLDHAVASGLLRHEHRGFLLFEADPVALIERLGSWVPGKLDKWLDRSTR